MLTEENLNQQGTPPPATVALAVVIPAYRAEFLGAALDSLLAQTSHGNFHVYVGDDASPQPLTEICEARRLAGLPLSYHRFADNCGARNLVSQWNRCVHLSRGEEWVWLFSDDDVADPRCVELFFSELKRRGPEVNVLRFNTATIDREGKLVKRHPLHPAVESAEAFAYYRLTFQRNSYAPDHIFRRAAFDRHGGFVSFPFALGSDDVSWITFAGDKPLVTIPEALVYWRYSGQNTSLFGAGHHVEKLLALTEVGAWMRMRFVGQPVQLDPTTPPVEVDFSAIINAWLRRTALDGPDLPLMATWQLAGELERRSWGSRHRWMLRFLRRKMGRYKRRYARVLKERRQKLIGSGSARTAS